MVLRSCMVWYGRLEQIVSRRQILEIDSVEAT